MPPSLPVPSHRVPFPISHPLCIWEGSTPICPHPGSSILYRIRQSSPTEARQASPLLHKYQRPRTAHCVLFAWWHSFWELQVAGVSWYCCSSYVVTIPFSNFNHSANSSIGVYDLRPMVVCKNLHLSHLTVGLSLSENSHARFLPASTAWHH